MSRKLIHEIPEEYLGANKRGKRTKEQKENLIKQKRASLKKLKVSVTPQQYKSHEKRVKKEIEEIRKDDQFINIDLGLGSGIYTRIRESDFLNWDKGYNKGVDKVLRKTHAEVNKLIKHEKKLRNTIKKEMRAGRLPSELKMSHDNSLRGLETYLRVIKNNISINRGLGELKDLSQKERYEMKFEKVGNLIVVFSS